MIHRPAGAEVGREEEGGGEEARGLAKVLQPGGRRKTRANHTSSSSTFVGLHVFSVPKIHKRYIRK